MKIKYQFQTGQAVEVEVTDDIGEVILQIERDTYNSDRRETRRHCTLSMWNNYDEEMADESVDIESQVISRAEVAELHQAIVQLRPDEQDLVRRLYLDHSPVTQEEYATEIGTTPTYIKRKAGIVRAKLKVILRQ